MEDGITREELVAEINEINLEVRRRVRFREMNRSNKSRLQFKPELIMVSRTGTRNGT